MASITFFHYLRKYLMGTENNNLMLQDCYMVY